MKIKLSVFLLFISAIPCMATSLTLYGDSDKTIALDLKIPVGQFRFSLQENKTNFGITATSSGFASVPVTLRAGNLSIAGSISKLNSPLLSSTSSPFSTGISKLSGITASLPGYTSFSKPVTLFAQTEYSPSNLFLKNIKVNTYYNPQEEQLAFSTFGSFNFFQKKLKVENAITSGFFSYTEQNSSSWFSQAPYYPAGNHFCSLYQLSLQYLKFYTSFTTGIYETPFESWSCIFRVDSKLTTSAFIFNFSSLYNPNISKNAILTSSDKTLKDCLQFRNGIQYKFSTGRTFPVYIKTGFQNYSAVNLSQTEHPLKSALGVQITTPFMATSFTGSSTLKITSTVMNSVNALLDSAGFQVKTTVYLQYFIPSLSCSVNINPSQDFSSCTYTDKFLLSVNYMKQTKINSFCSLTLTKKDDEYTDRKISFGITGNFMYKQLKILLKFSADNTF